MNTDIIIPLSRVHEAAFAPVLRIPNGVTDIDFYKNAFGAVAHMRLDNDDGSVHVAEFNINGAIFHLHEVTQYSDMVNPDANHPSTVTIGLFVADVHGLFKQAISAGATVLSPVTDYEYGYRQGDLKDPFGHHWTLQCPIPVSPDWNKTES